MPISAETAAFWDAARREKLVVQADRTTGRPQFYPRPIGLASGSRDLEWREVTGEGHIAAVTLLPSRTGAATILATVELDERVRLLSTILGDAAACRIGARVRVVWRKRENMAPMYAFELV